MTALQALFEIDLAGHDPSAVLDHRLEERELPSEGQGFVRRLVDGVVAHRSEIDLIVQQIAPEWPIDQMATIDRNILRLAVYEIIIDHETPLKVAINEAVELAKAFGSDSSPRFVNGALGTLASQPRVAALGIADEVRREHPAT
jgi:N utilization substance protein B